LGLAAIQHCWGNICSTYDADEQAENGETKVNEMGSPDLVLGNGDDQERLKKALIEIASRPGGREFLKSLDDLSIVISVQSGEVNGAYERIGGQNRSSEIVRQKDENGNVTDVKGDSLSVTLNFDLLDSDKKKNKEIEQINKAIKGTGGRASDMKDPIENVPASDAHLLGHGLAHGENQLLGKPNTESSADARINAIMKQDVDKKLAKDAKAFVENLLKPRQ
jgi:hypothetical protein